MVPAEQILLWEQKATPERFQRPFHSIVGKAIPEVILEEIPGFRIARSTPLDRGPRSGNHDYEEELNRGTARLCLRPEGEDPVTIIMKREW